MKQGFHLHARAHLAYGFSLGQCGRLGKVACPDAVAESDFARVESFFPCQYVEQGAFARAVLCYEANALPLRNAERDVLEQHCAAERFGQALNLKVRGGHRRGKNGFLCKNKENMANGKAQG